MVKLLIGRGGAGKSQRLLGLMERRRRERRQILIVPEQYSHQAERRLCAQGNEATLGCEVLTFTRLASRVFSVSGGLAAPTLDGGGRMLVMYLAVREQAQSLTVYAKPSRKPAFLKGLLDTLDECKSYRMSPRELYRVGEETGDAAGDKLRDLAALFETYDRLCETLGADPRDRLTRLARALRESRWAEGADVYLDCFTDFTPQEGLVLSALMAQANSVTFALTCDHLEEDEEGLGVFSPARRTAAFLTRLAREARRPVEVETLAGPRPGKAEALCHLEAQLFAPDPVPWRGPAPVVCARGESPRQEVEWTAGEILRLVREEGWRFREIAVTARSFEGYEELVESIFPRYGIPVFLSRSEDVLEKPVLALITGALDAVGGGYRYEDMFRYLKTGLANLTDEERDLLENYVLTWDIRGGKWTTPQPWHWHPRGYGRDWREEDEALAARLDEVRRRVAAPLERLRRGEGKTGRGEGKTGRARAMALYRFLEDIALPQTLTQRVNALRERGELTLAEEYGQLWDILTGALDQCAQLLGEVELEGEEFAKLFALVLSQYQVAAIPVALDRLTAGPCPRLGYQRCRGVFFLGCDNKRVPLCAPSKGLLTDDDRLLLAQRGFAMAPRMEDKLRREMTIAYNACTLPVERLYLLYPAAVEGEERRESFLIHRVRELFPDVGLTAIEALPDPRLAAPEPALELAAERPEVRAALTALPGWEERLVRLDSALGMERGSLSPQGVELVYGDKVRMSASQLDLCRSCHFSHFLRYGLRAEPRRRADFDAIEYGKFVHGVLERVVRDWDKSMDAEATHALTQAAMDDYLRTALGGLEDKTPRFVFLFRRLRAAVERVVDNVTDELRASRFQPLAFELGFGEGKELPPVELRTGDVTVSLSGFIDRVDGWVNDGKLYLRVVDYKTGKKPFDFGDILRGIGLQMLLYLSTLEREGEGYFHALPTAAGVLYIPARDALASGSRTMEEADRQAQVDKALTRQGLVLDEAEVIRAMEDMEGGKPRFLPLRVNKDGAFTGDALASQAQLGRLSRHVERILGEVGRELSAGTVRADPDWRGPEDNACLWCPYHSACQFEEGRGGDMRRWNPGVRAKDFWEKL